MRPYQAGSPDLISIELEGPVIFPGDDLPHQFVPLSVVQFAQISERRLHIRGHIDYLSWLAISRLKSGPQHFVTPHNLTEAVQQSRHVERASQANGHRNVVRRTAGLQLLDKPQPLLSKRKWKIVLSAEPADRPR